MELQQLPRSRREEPGVGAVALHVLAPEGLLVCADGEEAEMVTCRSQIARALELPCLCGRPIEFS